MINEESVRLVDESRFGELPGLIFPRYPDYNFCRIPGTALAAIGASLQKPELPGKCIPAGASRARGVALFLVDALGWNAISEFDHSFLRYGREYGVVSMLTSQFPSTTSAHVPTIATGSPVSETGVYEWWMLLPAANQLISPLQYKIRTPGGVQPLDPNLVHPAKVFTCGPIYQHLQSEGIRSTTINPRAIASGTAEKFLRAGAVSRYYERLAEIPQLIERAVIDHSKLIVCYIGTVDTAGHDFGATSREYREARDQALDAVEFSVKLLARYGFLTLTFADHGQVDVAPQDPQRSCMLDREIPELLGMLDLDDDGMPLPMAGGMRDAFLHVLPSRVDDAISLLQSRLEGRAHVMRTEPLVDQGLFGPGPATVLRKRLGNVLILPADDQVVTWSNHAEKRLHFKGDHGGLSRTETQIPLIAV